MCLVRNRERIRNYGETFLCSDLFSCKTWQIKVSIRLGLDIFDCTTTLLILLYMVECHTKNITNTKLSYRVLLNVQGWSLTWYFMKIYNMCKVSIDITYGPHSRGDAGSTGRSQRQRRRGPGAGEEVCPDLGEATAGQSVGHVPGLSAETSQGKTKC